MIVVLAEKPSVGRDLARILGAQKKCNGWLEGNGYQVTWAFGHLIELEEPESYNPALKKWSLETLPFLPESFKLKISPNKGVKEQFFTIKKLFTSAETLICATDAGREGELIFRYILEMSGCTEKPAKRLWISSLTDEAIKTGFQTLQPLSAYDNLAAAAKCRAQADWIVGLNATRGYTVQHSRGQGVLSVGRVQTPVLALIVNRNIEIENFQPENYWELWTLYRLVKFKHVKSRFEKEEEANKLSEQVAKSELVIDSIEEKRQKQPPPQLFDLTGLQKTMNRTHGFTAADTLKYAQSLYEKKFISYPRTDSVYLSDDLYPQCKKTLLSLKQKYTEEIAPLDLEALKKSSRFFNSKKVTDHHAIIATGQLPVNLDKYEQAVFDTIIKRFIAIFYPDCEKAHTTVTANVEGEIFKAKGTRIVTPGWFTLYMNEKKDDEQLLPDFIQGEKGAHTPEVKLCTTRPPKAFNEASLLSAMETAGKSVDDEELKEALKERGLGTPATRAAIIETLLKREYIYKQKKELHATKKGFDLIRLLHAQKTLTSAEMTADWEHSLKQIEKGKLSALEFISNIKVFTSTIIAALKEKMTNFGNCPLCTHPVIKGRQGYGCSSWSSGCPFRFQADQFGVKLQDEEVQALLFYGKTPYPKKLITPEGALTAYITLKKDTIGIKACEVEVQKDAVGACPQCSSSVIEKVKTYSCMSCDFVIWKKIAKRAISKTTAKALLSEGKCATLKGFRSKAGKSFEAALELKDGKVCFRF